MSDLQHERAVELEDEIATLRAELAAVRDARDMMGNKWAEAVAAARQDAEEKARLREALILARREISDHDSDYHHRTRESTIEAIRDALACRLQGGEVMSLLPEDPIERRMFDDAAKVMGDPMQVIIVALQAMYSMAPEGGSYREQLAIYVNEMRKVCRPQGERSET